MVRDIDIRRSLRAELALRHREESDTVIIEELCLCQGAARVDVAVVNGSFHGYEIKSERDTLLRLPGQTMTYNRALEYITIVVSPIHAGKAKDIIPFWWGISSAIPDGDDFRLVSKRKARPNPNIDPFAIAQFLWRDEAIQVLEDHGLAKGMRSKSRIALWTRLASMFTVRELAYIVREKLKHRADWRVHVRQGSNDD